MTTKAISFDNLRDRVRSALREKFSFDEENLVPWLAELFDEFVIAEMDPGVYWQIPYTATDEAIEFADRSEWVKVRQQSIWVETKMAEMRQTQSEQVIHFGSEVKALGNGKVGGYLVLFGDETKTDLVGDYFTKDTNFGTHQTSLVFYQHGLDKSLKMRVLDGLAPLKTDEVGIWVEAQLALRDEYEQQIYALAEQGKLGWSSGTANHLVEREQKSDNAWHITNWPLGLDASLTPTPAEPRTQAIPLKSIQVKPLEIPSKPQTTEHNVNINVNVKSEVDMAEENTPVREESTDVPVKDFVTLEQFEALSGDFKSMSEQLSNFMQKLEKAGPLKDAGYIAPDSETDRPETKSFGDFLLAVYRGNTKRLATVYKSTKDLSGETGTAGGFLVPEEFTNQLLQIAETTSQIMPRVTTVPVGSDTGRYPSLDQFAAPTAGSGNTAMAAGLVATTTAAGGTLTETEPTFEMIQWRVNKVGGYTEVENELIEDSPQSIEVLLTRLFGVAVRSKTEHYILRGTGAGEPEGIINAAAAIGITPATDNTFAWADATTMFSRFKPIGGEPVWMIHPGIWPDLGDFEVSAGSGGVFQANLQAVLGQQLLGYPILQSEHLPQDDNSGCVILADLSAYLLFRRSGLSIAFSEHAAFTTDKGTWRFTERLDGQTWLTSAITLADPQGSYTISPFVYLND